MIRRHPHTIVPMPGDHERQARTRDQSEPAKPRRAPSLFHPRRTLQLGDGLGVSMDRATAIDLLEWGWQSTRKATRTRAADTALQKHVTERIDAFRGHPELVHFGDLERIVFGYVNDPTDDEVKEPSRKRAA